MNGTVTIQSHSSAFSSLELAEETKRKLDEVNKDNTGAFAIECVSRIEEIDYYETKEDVPILNVK